MAFSTSFFTPDLLAAADNQPPTGSDTTAAAIMPHSDTNTPAPPSSDGFAQEQADAGSAGANAAMDATNSAPKAGPSKKKKGAAAAAKSGRKRARPGAAGAGSKKAKGGGTKKAKSDASSRLQSGPGAAADADADDSSESDNGPYCLCRGPDDHRFMIACDRCEDWFHGECIGMDKHTGENLVQKYICPNCTDGGRYATRYKKMCSLAGCNNPARIYDAARPSIFCSADHCQAWWEQLIVTLPRSRGPSDPDYLTQEDFIGLLDAPRQSSPSVASKDLLPSTPWRLGKPPFETAPDFWDLPSSSAALTAEEHSLLTTSAAARYQLGEEIVLCKKMLQLIDMALKRREAAIAAGRGSAKDLCGYDTRLDAVGATHQFALFLQSPQGEAIFKAGRLDYQPPSSSSSPSDGVDGSLSSLALTQQQQQSPTTATITNNNSNNNNKNNNDNTNGIDAPATTLNDPASSAPAAPGSSDDFACMCLKKKCKPHAGWSALLTRSVRHDMRELAAQAKRMLDAERRVRDGAAGRFRRRIKERNGVVAVAVAAP